MSWHELHDNYMMFIHELRLFYDFFWVLEIFQKSPGRLYITVRQHIPFCVFFWVSWRNRLVVKPYTTRRREPCWLDFVSLRVLGWFWSGETKWYWLRDDITCISLIFGVIDGGIQ